jgi:aspartyl-tRNA(Asn)/glutamyl-tRNA(Gln) amidotransferase subunit C
MAVTAEEVKRIAKLARLKIEEDKIEDYKDELNRILDWVDQLQELDTEGVAPMKSTIAANLNMREDEEEDDGSTCDRQKILANAPAEKYGCFAVPKVVE